jgi:hypothetical protein
MAMVTVECIVSVGAVSITGMCSSSACSCIFKHSLHVNHGSAATTFAYLCAPLTFSVLLKLQILLHVVIHTLQVASLQP